jgi:hypothetical protein
VKKLENKNLILRKSLICALLIAFVFSAMGTSMAYARETAPPPDNPAISPEDNPLLIAAQDNGTPVLDRTQDNSTTTADDNASLISTQDTQTEENAPLISPQVQPDNTSTILGVAAVVAAIAVAAIVAVLRLRKKL